MRHSSNRIFVLCLLVLANSISCAAVLQKPESEPPSARVLDISEVGADWRCLYKELAELEFVCTNRTCGGDPSEVNCLVGLAFEADTLEAEAIIVNEVIVQGRGHAGAELYRVVCRGFAVVSADHAGGCIP